MYNQEPYRNQPGLMEQIVFALALIGLATIFGLGIYVGMLLSEVI